MLCTPIHPDGIDGAMVQAAAVAALSLSIQQVRLSSVHTSKAS